MSKEQYSPTGRRIKRRAELQNITPNLHSYQRDALKKIKKTLITDRVIVSVNFNRTVVI